MPFPLLPAFILFILPILSSCLKRADPTSADDVIPRTTMLPTKSASRAEMLVRLRAVSPAERGERSVQLVANLVKHEAWQRAQTVGLFAPLRSEPDIDLLWRVSGGVGGKTVVYPRVEGSGGMVLRVVNRPEELIATAGRQLREPLPEAPALAAWPDMLLVPGLAFTQAGGRLGRGGGFYDRLLGRAERRVTFFVGIGFGFQLLSALSLEAHDAVLDEVITDG